ncbi:MAG: FAD binding domain-containing protein [Nitrospinota bacterium]
MKNFEFLEPASLSEACRLLTEREGSRAIAGGQSLIPLMKQRLYAPSCLVSLLPLSGLNYIREEEGGLSIGALTPHRSLELSPLIRERYPVLAQMAGGLGSVQIRNLGTLGGSLAHADPAGDPAPALLVLDARAHVEGLQGKRVIPLEEFFKDFYETALEPGEILVGVSLPPLPPRTGAVYLKESVRSGDMAILGVAVRLTLDAKGGELKAARIALASAGPTPLRTSRAESLLEGERPGEELFKEAARAVSEEICPTSELSLSEDYKRELARVLTLQGLKQSLELAQKS